MKKFLPRTFYNPLSLVGGAVFLLNIGLILFLIIVQLVMKHPSPHADMLIFIFLPALSLLGLLLVVLGMVWERRRLKTGGTVERRFPIIDLNDPRRRTYILIFGGGVIFLCLLYAFAAYKAYEYASSDPFCGLCHVNEPEYTAHLFSPHAQISCAGCHVGAGAKYSIRAKMNGTLELYKYIFNKYPRPLETPIRNLRPSRDICETCHGPKYQLGEKLVSRTYFLSDAENTKWTINLLLKMGTGRIETEKPPRIHWHDTVAKEISYASPDPKRMTIPWIRVTRFDGKERVYQSKEGKISEKDLNLAEKRVMDCIDCHNRDGHFFRQPARVVSAYLQLKLIDPSLPEIKSIAVKALGQDYHSKQEGSIGIRRTILDFYRDKHPDVASSKKNEIEAAVDQVQRIYGRNYDPAMKVNWKNFPDNAGHIYSLGCFRCHDGKHVSEEGKVLSKDCDLCHLLLQHQLEAKEGRAIVTLATNSHPVDIGDSYKEQSCSECHGANQ